MPASKLDLTSNFALGKFKADPVKNEATVDKVEELMVDTKPGVWLKSDETKDVKLNTEEYLKAKGKDSVNFDDAVVSCRSSKSWSQSPPFLAFGYFKRDSAEEPQTIKSEVVDQDMVLPTGNEYPSVIEEAVERDNAIRTDTGPRAVPESIREDVDLPRGEDNLDLDQPLPEGGNAQILRNSPTVIERRPAKRQRFFIELPTVESIYGKTMLRRVAGTPVEELNKKMEKMKNPKVKKLQGLSLSLDTVRDRLISVGLDPYPITLEKEIQDVMVKRRFISSLYGGNTQSTLPSIGKHFLDAHGFNDFMYPNLDLDPYAPQMPGSPGLFFAANGRHATAWDMGHGPGPERVITRIRPGIWQYQGQYVLSPTRSLTKEEWAAQSPKVHFRWAKQIMEKDWRRTVRCRVSLRKQYGREFTEEEFKEAIEDNTNSYKDGINEKDILRDLLRGDEFIAVWTMKCVGYDADFQRNLAEKYPTWVPPPPKPKKGSGRRRKDKKTTVSVKQEIQSDDDSNEEEEDDGNESDRDYEEMKRNRYLASKRAPQTSKTIKEKALEVRGKKREHNVIELDTEEEELVYKSRGTRSRPTRV